jgi:hypothetical protein
MRKLAGVCFAALVLSLPFETSAHAKKKCSGDTRSAKRKLRSRPYHIFRLQPSFCSGKKSLMRLHLLVDIKLPSGKVLNSGRYSGGLSAISQLSLEIARCFNDKWLSSDRGWCKRCLCNKICTNAKLL